LAKHGLDLIEDVGREEYQQRYLKPIGRVLDPFVFERIAVASSTGK